MLSCILGLNESAILIPAKGGGDLLVYYKPKGLQAYICLSMTQATKFGDLHTESVIMLFSLSSWNLLSPTWAVRLSLCRDRIDSPSSVLFFFFQGHHYIGYQQLNKVP